MHTSELFSNKKHEKVSATVIATLIFASQARQPAQAAECPVGQNGSVGTITAPAGAKLRESASIDSQVKAILPRGTQVTVTGQTEGQYVNIGGSSSEYWSSIVTAACESGFVSSLLVQADQIAPTSPESSGMDYKGGIFELLNVEIYSAKVILNFPRRTVNIRPNQLAKFVKISGRPGQWNGYSDPTPFDRFSYPYGGRDFAKMYLQTSQGTKEVWFWQETPEDPELLTFVWHNFEEATDSEGKHLGAHNFEWYVVPVASLMEGIS